MPKVYTGYHLKLNMSEDLLKHKENKTHTDLSLLPDPSVWRKEARRFGTIVSSKTKGWAELSLALGAVKTWLGLLQAVTWVTSHCHVTTSKWSASSDTLKQFSERGGGTYKLTLKFHWYLPDKLTCFVSFDITGDVKIFKWKNEKVFWQKNVACWEKKVVLRVFSQIREPC